MPPKEPTRHQLSSRLAYNAQTPAFLLRLQNQVAGRPTDEDDDEPQYIGGVDEFGRERRPPVPERPKEDENGSDNEEDSDDKPLVVVLKEGKHLDEEQAENERRKSKGLPPLPPMSQNSTKFSLDSSTPHAVPGPSRTPSIAGLSFSSTKAKDVKSSAGKRKASDDLSENKQILKKKSKKDKQRLLSFDETI